ncbi:MAG: NAD(P)/FAD-dependent oxidoreductase [Planctomycetaceae bacterium]
MRIAVVGTGIAGMVAAYALHRRHDIAVFEASDRAGGHAHTVDVAQEGAPYAVDTGFLVYNERNYPNFTRLLGTLGVASQPSTMSFSVRCEKTGLEYNGTSINTLFAQRRNLLRPSFYRMLRDILRFHKHAPKLLDEPSSGLTLGEFLRRQGLSREFEEHYLVPMGAAVWSTDPARVRDFPARHFVEFFHNHGMLQGNGRPQWRTISGGSRSYVDALTRSYESRIRFRTPVRQIRRHEGSVTVDGERFDHVVIAAHSDQALRMLADPTPTEKAVLGAIGYQRNDVVLHTDQRFLPRRKRAWAAWNYHIPGDGAQRVAVTYGLSMLQSLRAPKPFLATLNRPDIDPAQRLREFVYHHPVLDVAAASAQRRHGEISGVRQRTHYCGAYWGHGFHEDGVVSALRVCDAFALEPFTRVSGESATLGAQR